MSVKDLFVRLSFVNDGVVDWVKIKAAERPDLAGVGAVPLGGDGEGKGAEAGEGGSADASGVGPDGAVPRGGRRGRQMCSGLRSP